MLQNGGETTMTKCNINNLPVVTRKDGIIDVAENSCGITTVEAEFDRAMRAQGEYEREHPLESAVQNLEHAWKHNRFNSCTNYGHILKLYQDKPIWAQVKPLIEAKGLPVTWAAWKVAEANNFWKMCDKMVKEGRVKESVLKGLPWYKQYLELVEKNHPVIKGEWKSELDC
jgi:hypothetical protein